MQKWKRFLSRLLWIAGVLLLLLLLGALAATWRLRHAMQNSLAQLDGSVRLTGLAHEVVVRRDGRGVPQIDAANEEDLFAAQGYITAGERLWQMDMMRRNAEGELAEVLGPSLVERDRMQRTLQLNRVAEAVVARSTPDELRIFNAYARGVNLYLEQNADRLPVEFTLLHYRPRPWQPKDSIAIALTMAELLDSEFESKLGREFVSAKLKDPKLEADLYPVGSWRDHVPGQPLPDLTLPQESIPDVPLDESQSKLRMDDLNRLRKMLKAGCDECEYGSNDWAVGGKMTASGRPLLSNDMHLSLSEPNIWFMVGLSAPGYRVAGVTLPGVPMVVEGHNEHVAWGFTALYGDVQDLYVERSNAQHQCLTPQGWQPMAHHEEYITVRFGHDVRLDVESTAHGPIITPLLKHETRPIALRWNIYDPGLNFSALYGINHANNWAEFRKALENWWSPTQNLVYADDQGHIAYQAIGRVPRRPTGLMGYPIQDFAHEWSGYLTLDEMPHSVDPSDGFLATANSRVTSVAAGNNISLEWASPYRTDRIYKSLAGRTRLTRSDMLALQGDIYSEVDQELGHRFAYAIDHTPGTSDRLRQAADILRSWDGQLTLDAVAPSILEHAKRALWPLILRPRLGEEWQTYQWASASFAEEEIIMHGSSSWLPPQFKSWDEVLSTAVGEGLKEGHAPDDLTKWTYGSWHQLTVEHELLAQIPWMKSAAGVSKVPYAGNHATVKAAGAGFGPSQRFTMDWSDIDNSTMNITMGESGDPMSPYFKDQFPAWLAVRSFPMPFSTAAVARAATHTLRLEP